MSPPNILTLLFCALSLLSPPLLSAAKTVWKEYTLAEITLQVPADWQVGPHSDATALLFTDTDGKSTLLARWWTDDAGRSEREAILSSQVVVIDGKPAQLLCLRGDGGEHIKVVIKAPMDPARIFTLTFSATGAGCGAASSLFWEIIKRVGFKRTGTSTAPSSEIAGPSPQDVDLDDRLGQKCQPVDPGLWQHPVLHTLQQRQGVHLQWIQRCGDQGYLIFGADFDHDPQGQTNDFFYPLFIDVLEANSGQPLALVAVQERLLIQLRQLGPDQYDFNHAELDNPAAVIWKEAPNTGRKK